MLFIGIVLVWTGILWGVAAHIQASRAVVIRLRVPEWLARVCGSKTCQIDVGIFCLQVFCFLAFLWSIPSGLLSGDNPPGDILRLGLLVITVAIVVLFFSLVFLARRQEQ